MNYPAAAELLGYQILYLKIKLLTSTIFFDIMVYICQMNLNN